jgi:selenide,water dikinase
MIGEEVIKLTQYSHGAGCGCKISPQVLDQMLSGIPAMGNAYPALLVGNAERDDAAVFDLGDGTAIISTTDFFMPVVDDPFAFGRIAAANAISDVYAMGGKPLMAIAILGWPVNVLSAEIAGLVIQGGQSICQQAGIPLGGGHSIDSPEPIFGLAVTGRVDIKHLKKNGGAQPGDVLFLSKPIGVGILTTAQKKGKLREEHGMIASGWMMRLNDIGERLGKIKEVSAMTDVTGFGLAGHLLEMCRASNTSAELYADTLPIIVSQLQDYIDQGCIPGGTGRNYASYGHDLLITNPIFKDIVCDPQTSGGLLIAVHPDKATEVSAMLEDEGLYARQIGVMKSISQAVVELI